MGGPWDGCIVKKAVDRPVGLGKAMWDDDEHFPSYWGEDQDFMEWLRERMSVDVRQDFIREFSLTIEGRQYGTVLGYATDDGRLDVHVHAGHVTFTSDQGSLRRSVDILDVQPEIDRWPEFPDGTLCRLRDGRSYAYRTARGKHKLKPETIFSAFPFAFSKPGKPHSRLYISGTEVAIPNNLLVPVTPRRSIEYAHGIILREHIQKALDALDEALQVERQRSFAAVVGQSQSPITQALHPHPNSAFNRCSLQQLSSGNKPSPRSPPPQSHRSRTKGRKKDRSDAGSRSPSSRSWGSSGSSRSDRSRKQPKKYATSSKSSSQRPRTGYHY